MAGLFQGLFNKLSNRAEIAWDDLEADLIRADLGVKLTTEIIDDLKSLGRRISAEDVVEKTRDHITAEFPEDDHTLDLRDDGMPFTILIVGVNGTGKTTSTAKLAHLFKQSGATTLLAAADTFRAAAVEQLERWSERLGLDMVKGAANADPASVCYTAHQKAIREEYQFLICDTAGRLHTRHNLMEELVKVRRILSKQDETAPHLTLLVVDATTGTNALSQAREFQKAIPIDGLIVTKLDGSGKGGIVAAIHKELGIPPRFIGTGEEPDRFDAFSRDEFVGKIL